MYISMIPKNMSTNTIVCIHVYVAVHLRSYTPESFLREAKPWLRRPGHPNRQLGSFHKSGAPGPKTTRSQREGPQNRTPNTKTPKRDPKYKHPKTGPQILENAWLVGLGLLQTVCGRTQAATPERGEDPNNRTPPILGLLMIVWHNALQYRRIIIYSVLWSPPVLDSNAAMAQIIDP